MIAGLSFGATEVLKGIVNLFIPEWRLGLVFAVFFSSIFMVGVGSGLLAWVAQYDYSTSNFPVLVQYADIATTAFILSLGSKALNIFLEDTLGIDVSGGLKIKEQKTLDELEEENWY